MVIRVRPSELFRGKQSDGQACAIALAVRRIRPDIHWLSTWFGQTRFWSWAGGAYDKPGSVYNEHLVESGVSHTAFGRVLVFVHDAIPIFRWVLVPFLWLPVMKTPEDTFAVPPDRIITVPEPEREAWPIPQEQPVTAPAIELPIEDPAGVPA